MTAERQRDAIVLLDPQELHPHERIIFRHALSILARVYWDGMMRKPLLVDRETGVILDGHHRWWVSKRLGLSLVPCYCVDYLKDENILCEPRREDIPVTKEIVLAIAASGRVFPPKTTRHIYQLPASEPYLVRELRRKSGES